MKQMRLPMPTLVSCFFFYLGGEKLAGVRGGIGEATKKGGSRRKGALKRTSIIIETKLVVAIAKCQRTRQKLNKF